MRFTQLATCLFLAVTTPLSLAEESTGDVREILQNSFLADTKTFHINSLNTDTDYQVRVATPPGYGSDDSRYPLLVVLDGSMVFGTAAEAAALQAMTGETKPIIVAAVSTHGSLAEHNTRRLRDYTPSGTGNPTAEQLAENPVLQMLQRRFEAIGADFETGLGGAAAFQAFLEEELLPRLQQDYRVNEQELGLFGHSAGGVFCHSVLLSKSSPFSKFIIGTFATMWYGDTLGEREAAFAEAPAPHSVDVFYAYGGEEVMDFGAEAIDGSVQALERLRAADPGYIDSLLVWNFEREQHGSVMAPVIASGIHELYGTGVSYGDAAATRD